MYKIDLDQTIKTVAALIGLSVFPAAGFGQERLPVIDMHMHASDPEAVPRTATRTHCMGRSEETDCEFPVPPDSEGRDVLALTLEAMDRYNIVLGFLSRRPLEPVYEWVEAAPGRFIASPAVGNPSEVDPAMLRREYEAGRLIGMGEIGSQYLGIAADDLSLEPFFALAEEFDVPVSIHSHGTGAPGSERFRIDVGRPTRIEEVLVRHPTLRVTIESAGFPFLEDTIALMYRYPNVYGDLSPWKESREIFEWYLRRLFDAGLGKRLMLGSDGQDRPQLIGASIEAIESVSFLTGEQKRDILYNNAAAFLRLSDEEIAAHHR